MDHIEPMGHRNILPTRGQSNWEPNPAEPSFHFIPIRHRFILPAQRNPYWRSIPAQAPFLHHRHCEHGYGDDDFDGDAERLLAVRLGRILWWTAIFRAYCDKLVISF